MEALKEEVQEGKRHHCLGRRRERDGRTESKCREVRGDGEQLDVGERSSGLGM